MPDLFKLLRLPAPRISGTDLVCQLAPDDDRVVLFVTLFSADPARLAQALRHHRPSRRSRPVFVTTAADLRPIIAAGLTCEHLPGPDMARDHHHVVGGVDRFADYARIRWDRLHRKWRPGWTVDYGTPFESYLQHIINHRQTA